MLGKKGITPIIAVVLLLMMTVAAAGAAYFWMTTIQSRIQSQIGSQVVGGATTQYGALKIISTSCINSSPDVINITIQNTGTQSISAGTTSIVLSDITGAVLTTVTKETDALGVNELTTIEVEVGDGLINTSSIYGVKVTMPGGYDQEDSCVGK